MTEILKLKQNSLHFEKFRENEVQKCPLQIISL